MTLGELASALGTGNAEHERNFTNVFIHTPDYEAVARMSRSIILGGRGAGKSAIFRILADRSEAIADANQPLAIVPLAADRASWPALVQAAKAANNNALMLSRHWELTFLILSFNALIEISKDPRRKKLIRDLDIEMEKILERTDLKVRSEGMLFEVFEAAATMLRKLPFTFKVEAPFIPISIQVKEDSASPEPQGRDREKLQIVLIEGMYGVLRTLLTGGARVQILADQLDDSWTGRPEQISSLCALVTAVMRMKGILIQRGMDSAINFSIFLRTDIYEVLKRNGLDDATKYRRDEIHLKWDRAMLERMINRRIHVANINDTRSVVGLFDTSKIERRPLGEYFFSRTVPRPRDAIQFLGLCLEEATLRGEPKISSESLMAAELSYSVWRRDVILEEARYGGLKSPDSIIGAISSGPRTYSVKELNRRLDAAKRDYGITETKPVLIDALFEWGVLGVERARGVTQFAWDVRDLQRPRPRQQEEDGEEEMWVVHPSLWTALDLRPVRKSRSRPDEGS